MPRFKFKEIFRHGPRDASPTVRPARSQSAERSRSPPARTLSGPFRPECIDEDDVGGNDTAAVGVQRTHEFDSDYHERASPTSGVSRQLLQCTNIGIQNSARQSQHSSEDKDGRDTAEMAFSSDGLSTDDNLSTGTYIVPNRRTRDQPASANSNDRRRKSISDSPSSSGPSESPTSDRDESHCYELSAGGRTTKPTRGPPKAPPMSAISKATSEAAISRSSELMMPPTTRKQRRTIHAIQIPLVSHQANEERRKSKEKEDKKKTNFFKEIAQRFKERTISRRSHGSLTLTRHRKRNSSIGCESTKSIAFSRPPLHEAFYNESLAREARGSDSGMHTPYSFSDSHLDQHNSGSYGNHFRDSVDSISDVSSQDEELVRCQDSRSHSALDSHGASLHLESEIVSPHNRSPLQRSNQYNPNYESVYKTRSLESIVGFPQRRHVDRKRYSDIPTLLEDRILGGIPSPVVEENTPRSSMFIDKDAFHFEPESRTATPDPYDDDLDHDAWPIIPIATAFIVPDAVDGAVHLRHRRHPDLLRILPPSNMPAASERARKTRSRTLEISGPFNPVHVEGTHRPSSMLSTEENMRRYREIFGSVPAVNTGGGGGGGGTNNAGGKRPRAGSATSNGSNRAQRWLKFFPMRKAMSEETTTSGARSWEELLQTKSGASPLVRVHSPQQQHHGSSMFREASYIRAQLNEQLKWLDYRVESQTGIVAELQDYFRRRADVELEYSRQLDKLAKQLLVKHKNERPKREQWHLFSAYQCWQQLVSTTRKQSTDHAKVAEIYQQQLTSKLQHVAEDLARVYRKCRNIGCDEHEELLKILHELHTTMKTYHSYRAMEQQADAKLAVVEGNLSKVEQGLSKEKVAKSRRYRLLSKERQKRWDKAEEARIKALKARNDYVLCVEAANAGVQKYFVDDLSDLVDAVDFGFHTSLSRSLLMYNSTLECFQKSLKGSQDAMKKCLESLDSRADKQKFLESNNAAFMAPNKFVFQAHKGDVAAAAAAASTVNGAGGATNQLTEKVPVQVEDAIFEDMDQRFKLLQKRLADLKIENEEVWKTLETAERTLMDMIESRDYDVSPHFDSESDLPQVSILNSAVPSSVGGHSLDFKSSSPLNGASLIPKPPETAAIKLRADKHETEDFYVEKFREYSMQCSVIARLQARFDSMEAAMTRNNASGLERARSNASSAPPKRPRRKRIGRQAVTGQPKLFGGSLEEYAEAMGQEVPLIVRSCIRVINLFGLHHQGVFRVSGSQVEINNFREAFERGEDPLADVTDSSDINSVAGVLKLYLRELREPLFPIFYFDQLMEISQLSSRKETEFVSRSKDVVRNLPRPHFAVLRYLFAFLNHLSELSDENMMCPWNLAICFGPTLLPIPEDKNPVQVQPLVNELVKGLIVHQEEIFPMSATESGAVIYEKYITPAEGVEGPSEELDSFDASPSDVSAHNISTLLNDEELLDESSTSTRCAREGSAHSRSASGDTASGSISNTASDGDLVNDEAEISLNLFGKEDALEAVAQYDFQARHERELSFRRGEVLRLTQQLSADWWRGSLRGRHGLVPDKYIMLNIRDDQREASASGGEDRASSSSSDNLASTSGARDSLNHQGQHRPSADSQSSGSQAANDAGPSGTSNLEETWSEIGGTTCRTATGKSSSTPSNGLLITAIGAPTSMVSAVSGAADAPWQTRRRSLSPAELVGTCALDHSTTALHTNSLKRKLPLRATVSVDDDAAVAASATAATQSEFVSPVATIVNTSSASSVSSSGEESSPHTGAISRLRRQSPLQFARQQPSGTVPHRRGIHVEAYESSAELARDLSEALHQAINSLASTDNCGLTGLAADHGANVGSVVSGSLVEDHHHKVLRQANGFSPNGSVSSRSREPSANGSRGIYSAARLGVERSEPMAIAAAAAVVEPTVQIAAVRAIKTDAPDLVQDLPPAAASGGSSGGEEDDSPSPQPSSMDAPVTALHGIVAVKEVQPASNNLLTTDSRSQSLSTAERFAMSNQCTIRKGSPRPTPRNYERSLSSGSSTPSTPSSSPQQGVLSSASGDPFTSAQHSSLRRSSLGNVSPVLSLASTTSSSPSVQKLKRMFSEPDQRTPAPPLSPKPALKAKPVTLMKLGRRTNPIVAPRASPPDVNSDKPDRANAIQQGPLTSEKEGFPSASGGLHATPAASGPIREYKQTSC